MGADPIQRDRSTPSSAARERVWCAIRALRTFTLPDVVSAARVNRDVARNYLRALIRSGFLAYTGATRKRDRRMARNGVEIRLVRDPGGQAPRITRAGTAVRKGRRREHLWRSMKVLREFRSIDLAIIASTDELRISRVHAQEYITGLHAAGYLARTAPAWCGSKDRPATPARYRLIASRWTGPIPPQLRKTPGEVFDPNLGLVVTAPHWSAPR